MLDDKRSSNDLLKLWMKYEDIAMHFNDLIMRWRLQAIGGLAGLLTLSGFVVGDATTLLARYRAMLILSGALACGWIGVACIDLFYYRRLLQGAVQSLLTLEAKSAGRITLSTEIETKAKTGSDWMPWLFYVLGLLPLLAIIWWAIHQLNNLPPESAPTSFVPTIGPIVPSGKQ